MATWPASLEKLPAPVSVSRQDGFLRSDTDAGPGKVRRRFTATATFYQFTMRMTGAQYGDLMNLYDTSIDFDMEDPVSGQTENFQFTEPPSGSIVAGDSNTANRLYDVNINLKKTP